MTATSGQKCYESSNSLIPDGLLRRMCQELMTRPIWSSTQCYLTWKVAATKRSRLKFRLVPSVPRTEGSACGLWPTKEDSQLVTSMLPTPRGQDSYERSNWKTIKKVNEEGGDLTLTRWVKYQQRKAEAIAKRTDPKDPTNEEWEIENEF